MIETEYERSQRDCAKMLGMTLEEYYEFLKHVKPAKICKRRNKKEDAEILAALGLTEADLKKRKRHFLWFSW